MQRSQSEDSDSAPTKGQKDAGIMCTKGEQSRKEGAGGDAEGSVQRPRAAM